MGKTIPTIKGIFVKAHIASMKKERGEEGLRLLEEKFGRPLTFNNSDDVPLHNEVKLLEYAVKILNPSLPKEKVTYEAGKMHFKNFLTTPFGRILFPFFKNQFKLMILQSQNIAGHVFNGVTFITEDLGEKSIRLKMQNNDYPLEHFQGFLQEWINYSGLHGTVDAAANDDMFEYTMKWE